MNSYELRPMNPTDLLTVLAWRNHPDIRRWMFNRNEISLMEHQNWFESAANDPTRSLLLLWQKNVPQAFVGFDNIKPNNPINWGFYCAADSPKGTGSILGRKALNHGFHALRAHKIVGQIAEFNVRSLQFHQKFGFQQEGRLRQQFFAEGKYWDQLSFGLLASEWSQTQWNETNGNKAAH
jgi:UDP-4-amino-4,6-dideoxy-N-acetyl-beta-L-altrosamine N-acetyltransferase